MRKLLKNMIFEICEVRNCSGLEAREMKKYIYYISVNENTIEGNLIDAKLANVCTFLTI